MESAAARAIFESGPAGVALLAIVLLVYLVREVARLTAKVDALWQEMHKSFVTREEFQREMSTLRGDQRNLALGLTTCLPREDHYRDVANITQAVRDLTATTSALRESVAELRGSR